jgi:hypothetical protein
MRHHCAEDVRTLVLGVYEKDRPRHVGVVKLNLRPTQLAALQRWSRWIGRDTDWPRRPTFQGIRYDKNAKEYRCALSLVPGEKMRDCLRGRRFELSRRNGNTGDREGSEDGKGKVLHAGPLMVQIWRAPRLEERTGGSAT